MYLQTHQWSRTNFSSWAKGSYHCWALERSLWLWKLPQGGGWMSDPRPRSLLRMSVSQENNKRYAMQLCKWKKKFSSLWGWEKETVQLKKYWKCFQHSLALETIIHFLLSHWEMVNLQWDLLHSLCPPAWMSSDQQTVIWLVGWWLLRDRYWSFPAAGQGRPQSTPLA